MSDLQTTLLECEYFPCITWYEAFINSEQVLLEKQEYFERASLRNRCYVAGPNGKLALTVPLEGGRNQKTLMKELKICNRETWQSLHWKTLQTCYNRSPYFEYFADELKFLFEKKYTYLLDVNIDSFLTINKLLSVKQHFSFTALYEKEQNERVIDFRKKFKAESRATDIHASYMQPFEEKNGFIAGLSMLDMLFCIGKRSTDLLLSR